MFKDFFDKGKCALGFHAGEWSYETDGSCRQTRICPRCQNQSHQLAHDWLGWQYAAHESCDKLRQCRRCRETEHKIEHSWGAPVYDSESACTQVRPCSRCNETTAAGTSHVWGSWSYPKQNQCAQVSACSRCGASGDDRRVAHQWGEWQASRFYQAPVRVCQRCGELVFDLGNDHAPDQSVSLQALHRAVQEVIDAKNSDAVRERIGRQRTVLFDPAADKYFNFAVDQLASDDADQETLRSLNTLLKRCRAEGIDAVFKPAVAPMVETAVPQPAPAGAKNSPDPRLTGHWRSTEILGAGSSFSHAIDTHCLLDGGGQFQWYSRSASGAGNPEQGRWSSNGKILSLQFNDGTQRDLEYVIDGATLFCPRESRYRLWQRFG